MGKNVHPSILRKGRDDIRRCPQQIVAFLVIVWGYRLAIGSRCAGQVALKQLLEFRDEDVENPVIALTFLFASTSHVQEERLLMNGRQLLKPLLDTPRDISRLLG